MILGAVAFLFAGCQKDELAPAGQGSSAVEESVGGQMLLSATLEQQGGENGGTKTYLSGSSVYWTEGDAIRVYNSAGNQSAELTAKTGGSSKTTFSGTGSFAPLYAIYPSDCNPAISGSEISFDLPPTQNYTKNTFSRGANVTVGKVSGSSISFKNVCGALKLTITSLVEEGTIDHIKIVANSERLNGRFKVDASSATPVAEAVEDPASEADRTVIINCAGTEGATIGDTPKTYYAILPENALKGGFTVYVCNADETWAQPIDASNKSGNNTIKRSTITKMPTFDVEVGVIDLSIKESANCYMVNKAGLYRFKAVKGNSKTSVEPNDHTAGKNIARAAIFWETINSNTTTEILQGCTPYVREVGAYKYVYFKPGNAFSNYVPGSAGVAVLDDNGGHGGLDGDVNGHVLWSWHIWCVGENMPADTPYASSSGSGTRYIMDRNLGALATNGQGFLYQWGRKDPFQGDFFISSDTDYQTTIDRNKQGGKTLVWNADLNPRSFWYCTQNEAYNHWSYDDNNTTLWGSSKTVSDPCPPGYKVPDPFDTITEDISGWPLVGIRSLNFDVELTPNTAQYWANVAAYSESYPYRYVGSCYNAGTGEKANVSYCKSGNPVRCEKIQ